MDEKIELTLYEYVKNHNYNYEQYNSIKKDIISQIWNSVKERKIQLNKINDIYKYPIELLDEVFLNSGIEKVTLIQAQEMKEKYLNSLEYVPINILSKKFNLHKNIVKYILYFYVNISKKERNNYNIYSVIDFEKYYNEEKDFVGIFFKEHSVSNFNTIEKYKEYTEEYYKYYVPIWIKQFREDSIKEKLEQQNHKEVYDVNDLEFF
jgi:hypothetical protein